MQKMSASWKCRGWYIQWYQKPNWKAVRKRQGGRAHLQFTHWNLQSMRAFDFGCLYEMRLLCRIPCGIQKASLPDKTVVNPLRSEEWGVVIGASHRLNYISNGVGTTLALSDNGSLVKGAVVFLEQKNDWGIFIKSYKINLTIPPSCLRQPTSLYKGGWMYGCSQSAKVGASYGVNYISNGVGRWLAAAVEINENKTAFG